MSWDRRLVTRRGTLATLGCVVAGGCTTQPDTGDRTTSPDQDAPETEQTDSWVPTAASPLEATVEPTKLIINLDVPWDLAFTPTNDLFVTERTGTLLRFEADEVLAIAENEAAPLDATAVPTSDQHSFLGDHLLGLTTHPEFPDPSFLYVYVSIEEGSEQYNQVLRYDPQADDPEASLEIIIDRIEGDHTIGGRVAFGPEDDLWVPIGTKDEQRAQDPTVLGGSVLRCTPDGDPAPSNPSLDVDADPRVASYGHRNPQGIDWLPTGVPVLTDHGPTGHDEINRHSDGGNYGWPTVRTEPEYEAHPDYDRPLVNTGPDETWAPANCVRYTGDAISAWHNRLLVATLQGMGLSIITLRPPDTEQPPVEGDATRYDAEWFDKRYTATAHQTLSGVLGRIRNVAQAPDGTLLVSSSNRDGLAPDDGQFPRKHDDVLVQLQPVSK
ncbi:glucose / sorbosone dehydrogenase [Halalkalicoccus paucihalophilus]|uniref:Glucose / sorbosone dehydrogenase n=1 Tax=Halalkalicoccus paucihalophilus TaxID=1008153 RepID=A0A151A9A6_9EURY|nr:PQQ-dependent sugar dehydrogenase [Halalkalicoccus paucihalophilus]KYH24288.1 glucose / sorbosone dehydrogenase [Halalkalicoccus paucihalophilus]